MWGRAPAHRLKGMHDQGCSASNRRRILLRTATGRRVEGACPVTGGPGSTERADGAARQETICHAQLQLEGPADPRVSLLVDTPRRSGGLFERAMVDGLDHLLVRRRGRLLGRRPGFDDFAGTQNQSQGQGQSRCRQSAVSVSSQAYGSHFPSPVLVRRGRPDDVHYTSNFRARMFGAVSAVGLLDPIRGEMVAWRGDPRVTEPSRLVGTPPQRVGHPRGEGLLAFNAQSTGGTWRRILLDHPGRPTEPAKEAG